MTDTDALYAAILKHPGDDAPRLMYADALDERAEGADVLRAEFIRKQIELYRIGEPYTRVVGHVGVVSDAQWKVVSNGTGLRVGGRVDLYRTETKFRAVEGPDEWKGLLIKRIEPLDPSISVVTLYLHKDEFSGPYPQKRRDELMRACIALATDLRPATWMGPGWNYQWPKNRREDGYVLCRFSGLYPSPTLWIERGFPSVVEVTWTVWTGPDGRPAAHHLIRSHPISKVCFVGGMELPLLQRANKTTSRFSLPAPMSDVSLMMTDKEYRSLDAGSEWKEPSPAESEITRRLLHKAWPTVLEWDLDEDGDRNYDPSDWSQIRRSRRAAPDS